MVDSTVAATVFTSLRAIDWVSDEGTNPHEAKLLQLDSSKARRLLGWEPKLTIEETLGWTVDWYRGFRDGEDARTLTDAQLARYEEMAGLG